MNIWHGDRPVKHYFTIEMAPSEIMPIAVLTFLQQVATGLWDDTSFHINADHVLVVRPVSGSDQISKLALFEQSDYGKLPFVETVHSNYPHRPYTLGYIGAGPAFYVNKVHNEHNDACFAKVVVGRDTIDLLGRMRGYDHDPTLIRPVDTVSARIVTPTQLNEKARLEYQTNRSQ